MVVHPLLFETICYFLYLLTLVSKVCDGVSVRGDVHHGRDNCDGNGHVESSQIDPISSLTLPRFPPGRAGKHS